MSAVRVEQSRHIVFSFLIKVLRVMFWYELTQPRVLLAIREHSTRQRGRARQPHLAKGSDTRFTLYRASDQSH